MNIARSPSLCTSDLPSDVARDIRMRLIDMHHTSGAAHLGSALSCVDILVSLYWNVLRIDPSQPDDPKRDRLIFSKGHAVSALYTVLGRRGFFSENDLASFGKPGGRLPEQPAPGKTPGVELATGSLGHGLCVGVGLAKAAKIKDDNYRVFVVMSDGECNEGSVWEAAMIAPVHQLNNLVVIVDFNRWQATGRSDEIMALESLADKWRAFGWRAVDVDGHDVQALQRALTEQGNRPVKPLAIIAHTIKGKGVSFMEDDNNWHYRVPSSEELAAARRELATC